MLVMCYFKNTLRRREKTIRFEANYLHFLKLSNILVLEYLYLGEFFEKVGKNNEEEK